MSLSKTAVQDLARLARLRVEAHELPALSENLSRILALVERMQAVDTTDVEPLAHPLDMIARLRPDVVTEHDRRERLLSLAPAVAAGYYLVPKVIE